MTGYNGYMRRPFCKGKSPDDCIIVMGAWSPLLLEKNEDELDLERKIRLKLETMTGTGRAITSTPLREQMEPKIFPAIVFGTMSPYLTGHNKAMPVGSRARSKAVGHGGV
ncbi:hypothetical protein F7725_017304 [Dissostichus mawsoni]|uniref:Uncharacterized protein n=1 Tax=Dissostichus mawsoni TaxID=36200 RepID=A0A7J5Z619_DISMA|nr:hypothetical protein F7725_017304 [Dissostichus mawsoni]